MGRASANLIFGLVIFSLVLLSIIYIMKVRLDKYKAVRVKMMEKIDDLNILIAETTDSVRSPMLIEQRDYLQELVSLTSHN